MISSRALGTLGMAVVMGVAAPAAATVPPAGSASTATSSAGVVAPPEQIARLIEATHAPNNFCAFAGTYYQAVFGNAGGTTINDSSVVNPILGRVAPAMSALANDIAANPPAGLPPVYDGVVAKWVTLFGKVIDELKAAGITDEQLAAVVAATPDGVPAGVDQRAYDAAVAGLTTDLQSEFNAIVDDAEKQDSAGFSVQTFCPNLDDVASAMNTTNPAVLRAMFDSPNSFCAMGQVYLIAALTSVFGGDTELNNQLVGFAPALAALADDVMANPPDGLPAAVGPIVDTTSDVMGQVVEQLKSAGLTDADLRSMLQTVLQSSDSETAGSAVPSADSVRVQAAMAKVTVDLKSALQKFSKADEATTAAVNAYCPLLSKGIGFGS